MSDQLGESSQKLRDEEWLTDIIFLLVPHTASVTVSCSAVNRPAASARQEHITKVILCVCVCVCEYVNCTQFQAFPSVIMVCIYCVEMILGYTSHMMTSDMGGERL